VTVGSDVAIRYPVDGLVSFHYYRRDADMDAVTRSGRLRLIGDSGAYSAFSQGAGIALGDYAAWCTRWQSSLFWIAALDVIGDPAATFRNWKIMLDTHGLLTVPTLHAGLPTRWLDAYADEGVDFIGLGGMVGGAPAALRWLVHTFRHARDHHPHIRFHGWGVTHRRILDTLPFFSVDSSGVLGAAYRYAKLRLFDPRTSRHHSVDLDGRDVFRLAPLLRGTYGVDPNMIATSHAANRAVLIRLAASSTQQWASWLQRRHKVSAPRTGVNTHSCDRFEVTNVGRDLIGPRLHLVSAAGGGGQDDLLTASDLPALVGPRVHVVDTDPSHLGAVTGGAATRSARTREGTR
jgi:hypothetical protein